MSKPKTYRVGYWLEQGYTITVKARSPAHAERVVRSMLDTDCDVLPNSSRVHYGDGICDIQRVRKEARHG